MGLQFILLLLLKDRFSFKTEQHSRCRNFSYLMVKRWLNEDYSVLFNLILFFNGQGNISSKQFLKQYSVESFEN